MTKKKISRGLRNNNPFNIKHSQIAWFGEVYSLDGRHDKTFVQFSSIEFGYRAGIKLLYNYHRKGFDSVRSVINRFAPVSENNTLDYIGFVSSRIGLHPDCKISNFDDFIKLCKFMCAFESLCNVSVEYLENIVLKYLPYVEDYFRSSQS